MFKNLKKKLTREPITKEEASRRSPLKPHRGEYSLLAPRNENGKSDTQFHYSSPAHTLPPMPASNCRPVRPLPPPPSFPPRVHSPSSVSETTPPTNASSFALSHASAGIHVPHGPSGNIGQISWPSRDSRDIQYDDKDDDNDWDVPPSPVRVFHNGSTQRNNERHERRKATAPTREELEQFSQSLNGRRDSTHLPECFERFEDCIKEIISIPLYDSAEPWLDQGSDINSYGAYSNPWTCHTSSSVSSSEWSDDDDSIDLEGFEEPIQATGKIVHIIPNHRQSMPVDMVNPEIQYHPGYFSILDEYSEYSHPLGYSC